MNKIINEYKKITNANVDTDTEIEFEVRYYLDPKAPRPDACKKCPTNANFQDLLQDALPNLPIARAAKFIDVAVGSVRRRVEFSENARTETWIEKTRINDYIEPNDFGGLRVALSRERVVKPVPLDAVTRVVGKYRMSYNVSNTINLEISAVKNATVQSASDLKRRMLQMTPADFRDASQWDFYEVEVEHKEVEMLDVYNAYKYFYSKQYDMLRIVTEVAARIAHPKYQSTFANISPRNTIARLLPRAVEPALDEYLEKYQHKLKGTVLRDKIDGKRELVIIDKNRIIAVNACGVETWNENVDGHEYIFDAEYYDGVWYVLHALVWRGVCISNLPDSERLAIVKRDKLPCCAGLTICPYTIIGCDDGASSSDAIREWWTERKVPYPRDGLILAEDAAYFSQYTLKWKPADESTIDFLIVKCPEWLVGKAPFVPHDTKHIYLLNIGCQSSQIGKQIGFPYRRYLDYLGLDNNQPYLPFPFSPADCANAFIAYMSEPDLHGHIGEFVRDHEDRSWTLRRLRQDKHSILRGGSEIGNDVKTATDIWNKHEDVFPLESIWQPAQHVSNSIAETQSAAQREIFRIQQSDADSKTVILHMCPFSLRTSGPVLAIRDERAQSQYKSKPQTGVEILKYEHIGKIQLPKRFIGGCHTLVTVDPQLLAHVSCLSRLVIPGGRIMAICKFRETNHDPTGIENDEIVYMEHPEICREALYRSMERSGLTIETCTECDKDTKFYIATFKKHNRGATLSTTVAVVHEENPHLRGNVEAQYQYKYTRQKTKDMTASATTSNKSCAALLTDAARARALIIVEFLTGLDDHSQVHMVDEPAESVAKYAAIFPALIFTETLANADAVVCYDMPYRDMLILIKNCEPNTVLTAFDAEDTERGKIIKGKTSYIPYAPVDSTRVALHLGRSQYRQEQWSIIPEIFRSEMRTFHEMYRPSAYRYIARLPGTDLDDCYDCRTFQCIVLKYARRIKISSDLAYERVCSLFV